MSDLVNVGCPCDGDVFVSVSPASDVPECSYCLHMASEAWTDHAKCLGSGGWPILAFTSAEVALERATGPSVTGGTVTNVTLYPPGTDPRLVQGQEATR